MLIAAKIGHLGLFKYYFNNTSPLITGDNAGTYKGLQEILEGIRDHEGNTVAHLAAKNGHQELWQDILLKNYNRLIDIQGSRSLYIEIIWLNQLNINTLLNNEYKYINGLNNNAGHQPSDYAFISFRDKANIFKEKVFPCIYTITKCNIGHCGTPLFTAILRNADNKMLENLIDNGADLNATFAFTNKITLDLLQFCILMNKIQAFTYLSTHGCNLEKRYKYNESLLFWLGNNIANGSCKDDLNFFKLLYDKLSTTINDQSTQDGQTLLHRAINGSNKHFIKKLIELKPSCSLQDHQGNTPLHLGLLRNDVEVDEEFCTLAQSLMNQEVISTKNNKGKTPSNLIIERLKRINQNQKHEQILLGNLFRHIKENYKIENEYKEVIFENNSDDDDSATGDNYFNPVEQRNTFFETIEKEIFSLFSPLGNLLNKYLGKK